MFGRGDGAGIKNARKLAEEVFGHGWEKKGADIYKEGPKRATIWGIGTLSFISYSIMLILTTLQVTVTSILPGFGPTASPNKRWLDPGRPKSI